MANDNPDKPITLLHSIIRMLDAAVQSTAGYSTVMDILALICLFLILNRHQTSNVTALPPSAGNPLQKLLGELGKSNDGSLPADALSKLLPLLNNSQVKSKLTPANIAAILGLLNSLSSGEKQEGKNEKQEKSEKEEINTEPKKNTPAATITTVDVDTEGHNRITTDQDTEKKDGGRYLNWKNHF